MMKPSATRPFVGQFTTKLINGMIITAVAGLSIAASQAQEKVIRIGALLPASGPGSYFGVMGKQGAELALEELNKTGVNGYKFVINYEDSQCSPLAATNAAKRMLENFKPHVTIGEECSDATLAAMSVLEEAKVPLINAGSATVKFTESGYKYAFRIFPDAKQQTDSLAINAIKNIKAKNAILLNEKTNAGIDISDNFEKTFVANGGKVLGRIEFARDVSDFTSIATRVASMGDVDVLLVSALEGQTVKLAQALAQAGVTKGGGGKAIQIGTIWVPWGYDQKAGKASVGYTRISQFDPNEKRPVVQNFVKNFKAKYGADVVPTHLNAHTYDQILIIAEAVKRGATNSEEIKNQLLKMVDVEVTTGKITFGPTGQNQNMSVIHYVETNPDLSWKTLNW
ncbi:ABC transporter substrate-binding protein [Polynucleobacter kasalickyi]|uniref:Amino acid/amide ABC transporter substrate-binding protein, HAAT family n=1 Tax=Polynucleobacter kasalickyi TaxID=1938817 RepID=A0A1W2ALB1_9BURK|nr:ABC transporter substrate-binding protein [Polynucleobacter kasalickyi]SMC61394.1 amino acid/amide ABC transporter substrate-binding protein, HAAT family [Polynucleobacter kasalickyi]